jgi:SapC
MANIVLLNKEAHRSLKVDTRASAAHGDNQRFTPVMVSEFSQLAIHYPILFSKDANTGRFYCGAMLGFDEGENLFLEEWAEREFYRPLTLQRGPFYAQGREVAIDLDDPRVGADGGQPIFTEHGQPTKFLQSIIWAFQDLAPGLETTKIFVAKLTELNLIEPIDLEVECADGSMRHCVGLYTVNQETLARLPDKEVVELFRRGYLRLIDVMLVSLKNFPLMARRKNSRVMAAAQAPRSPA